MKTVRTKPLAAFRSLLAASLIAAFLPTPVFAQEEQKPPKLFTQDSVLNITLDGPWRTLMRENKKGTNRYDVVMSYTDHNGQQATMNIQAEPRGLTRRYKVCDFPPLKLFFPKEERTGTIFRGQKDLKLVAYCRTSKKFAEYNNKEFLIYRIYNMITDYSFRVRPLQITWTTGGKKWAGSDPRFGFLIEDISDVAKRNDLDRVKIGDILPKRLDSTETARYALFQYLIANLDWAATGGPGEEDCCHNGKLIGTAPDVDPLFAIPYDFDSAGLIDAPYAAPPNLKGVRSITDRLYRGFCVHNDSLPGARADFLGKQDAILNLFREQTALSERERNNSVEYLQEAFDVFASDASFAEEITANCR